MRICRERRSSEGWQAVASYQDAAISGSTVILRPGIQSLLQMRGRGISTWCWPKR